MNYVRLIVVTIAILGAGQLCAGETRIWTDTNGRQLRAELVDKSKDSVVLLRSSDGRQFTVPLSKLSKDDHAWLKTQSGNRLQELMLRGHDYREKLSTLVPKLVMEKDQTEKLELQAEVDAINAEMDAMRDEARSEFLKFLPDTKSPFAMFEQTVVYQGNVTWMLKKDGKQIGYVAISYQSDWKRNEAILKNASSKLFGVAAQDGRRDDGTGFVFLVLNRQTILNLSFSEPDILEPFLEKADLKGLIALGW